MAIHPRGGFPVLHPVALQATQRSIGPVRASPPSAVVTQWCFERITVDEIHWPKSMSNRPGSGMVPAPETHLSGWRWEQKELLSLVFKVPPNTAIQPHWHPDKRSPVSSPIASKSDQYVFQSGSRYFFGIPSQTGRRGPDGMRPNFS